MAKKVFISYDHSEDRHYKELLRAWDANTDFDFEIDTRSPNLAINSVDAGVIKSALTKKMKESKYLLVLIGAKSYTSDWMFWEIERAKQPDVKLKLAAVKIDKNYITPPGLLGTGTAFAYSFTRDGIIEALNKATNFY